LAVLTSRPARGAARNSVRLVRGAAGGGVMPLSRENAEAAGSGGDFLAELGAEAEPVGPRLARGSLEAGRSIAQNSSPGFFRRAGSPELRDVNFSGGSGWAGSNVPAAWQVRRQRGHVSPEARQTQRRQFVAHP